ncbi:MAG: HEAT repeat domain-containing protein [Candidatus Micrarchaeota archaeon]
MSKEEDLAKRLLRKLSTYGAPGGPSTAEAAEALHDLGATASSLGAEWRKKAEVVLLGTLEARQPQPLRLYEGAVKGAAALGTENAGMVLSRWVHAGVRPSTAREALNGMAALLQRKGAGGKGTEKMKGALEEATAHPSGTVRALAAEYLGTHGDAKHLKKLESLATDEGERYVRNSARRALEELRRRLP